jgi:hypothetical protein
VALRGEVTDGKENDILGSDLSEVQGERVHLSRNGNHKVPLRLNT